MPLLFYILNKQFNQKEGEINGSGDQKRLLKDIFSNYDSMVRPVKNPHDKIELYLGIKLTQISDIVILEFII